MRKNTKKLLAIMLTAMLVVPTLVGCSTSTTDSGETTKAAVAGETTTGAETSGDTSEVEKPERITIMVNTSLVTKVNGQEAFKARWEELTGIELVIIQPDHDAYADVLGQTFASGIDNWPDAIRLDSNQYTGYASEGALWDMSAAYEASDLKDRMDDSSLMDGFYIDGGLYGFAPARGNGCITYIKKNWLDNVGLDVPTTYEEYKAVLKAFTEEDPDGNGIKGDTYAVSSAGFMYEAAPYTAFLPEFYQDAYPAFYQKEDGTWVDGFTEDSMKEALLRLKEAYEAGWLDRETLTNGTSDCRTKFYEEKFGIFTYWAGTWATTLKNNLENNGHSGELVAIPPMAELGQYMERPANMWCITLGSKNPEGVFKYLIETMVDGEDMQLLWTYGVEDVHWSTKAGEVAGNTYEEGQFHGLESLEVPGTQYARNHLDPMLLTIPFKNGDPGEDAIAKEARNSQLIFNNNSKLAPLPVSTDEMSQYNGDLMSLKRSIMADIVTQGVSVEEGMARFDKDGGTGWSQAIVESLNMK
jgi:ABC-type sugar transport system, periplasmic component